MARRNTSWMELAYVLTNTARMGTLKWCRMAGVTPALFKPLGNDTPFRALPNLWASTLVKMAPKMAAPNEPPMERKKVAPAVATPISL